MELEARGALVEDVEFQRDQPQQVRGACTRAYSASSERASALASAVLPTPGASSIRRARRRAGRRPGSAPVVRRLHGERDVLPNARTISATSVDQLGAVASPHGTPRLNLRIGLGRSGYPSRMTSRRAQTISVEEARKEIAGAMRSPWTSAQGSGSQGHVPGADSSAGWRFRGRRRRQPARRGRRLVVIADDGSWLPRPRAASPTRATTRSAWTAAWQLGVQNFNTQPTADPDEDTELGAGEERSGAHWSFGPQR